MSQFFVPPDGTNTAPCPRCHKPLIDPGGLGWCKACGYCRSLAECKEKAPEQPKEAPAATMAVTASAIRQLPMWFWVTLGGVIIIAGVSGLLGLLPLSPLPRAVLTTVLMVVGFLIMFTGQFIAVMQIAPDESTLSFKDAVFPFRLYGLVMKRLPNTQFIVYLCAWGLAVLISAAVFIGGLDHWFTYIPKSQVQTQKSKK
jgi:hypothetical protein